MKQSVRHIEDPKSVLRILKEHGLNKRPIFILTDENTVVHCLPILLKGLPKGGKECLVLTVDAGEKSKHIKIALDLIDQLLHRLADRSAVLINLGGGMICDLGAFVSSIYKRGITFVHVPTTLLAQVDASIGGKTGVNHNGLKNMIGTFNIPIETIIYPGFLKTLPKAEVMAGFAEMVKHALVADKSLWKKIIKAQVIDLPLMTSLIERSINTKLKLVKKDFLEKGERKKLNFGHTIGHALESLIMESPQKDILHGEAVALGMIVESYISFRKGLLEEDELDEIAQFISLHYVNLPLKRLEYHRAIEIMRQDKKNRAERINMTLLKGIGDAVIDQDPSMDIIIDGLTYLERYPFPK